MEAPDRDKTPPLLKKDRLVLTRWGFVFSILCALVGIIPGVFEGPVVPSALNISVVSSVALLLLAGASIFWPSKKYLSASDEGSRGEIRSLEDLRLSGSLWAFVLAFGTTLALLSARQQSFSTRVEFLSFITSRLFVVWFLGILTMVATRLINRLDSLQDMHDSLFYVLNRVDETLGKFQEQEESIKRSAHRTLKAATKAVGILEGYKSLIALELEIEQDTKRPEIQPTSNFAIAANSRLELMRSASQEVWTQVQNRRKEQDETGHFILSNILIPALLPYLGTDPWEIGSNKTVIVQRGSYLLYADFIQGILREIIRIIATKEGRAGLDAGCEAGSLEVLTTLSVTPRNFYNVVGSAEKEPTVHKCKFDSSATTLSWEHYRAVQTLAIAKGRETECFGFTRCFVLDPTESKERLENDLVRAYIHNTTIKCDDILRKRLESQLNKRNNRTLQGDSILRISNEYLREQLEPMKRDTWGETLRGNLECLPQELPSINNQDYSHPIVIYGSEAAKDADLGNSWTLLGKQFIHDHFTSPSRALIVKEDPDKLRLPRDVFAVGWNPNGYSEERCEDLNIAFVVSLEIDDRGTRNRTRILIPEKPDPNDDDEEYLAKMSVILGTETQVPENYSDKRLVIGKLVDDN